MKSVGLNVPLAYYSFAVPVGALLLIYYTLLEFRKRAAPPSATADER